MRYLRKQGGFTLVELMLVLGITSLLVAGVMAGAGGIQNNTAFSSAIDSVRLQLKEVQNEAFQSVVNNSSSTVGQSDQSNFGKIVELVNTPASAATQMKTWTLVESADKTSLMKCDEVDVTLDQQVSFLNASNGGVPDDTEAIVFGRNPNQTYVDPNFVDPQGSSVPAGCNPTASLTPPVSTGSTICPGFTRTQDDPQGTCPPPNPPPAPPPACNAQPTLFQCGLFGQYYTGAITNASRTLDSAFIDEGIGELPGAVQSNPSFLPVLANRTVNPPAGVSVHWSGNILVDPTDATLASYTYCFSNSYIGSITIAGVTTGSVTSPSANPACVTVTPAQLTQGAGWYPITIDYQTITGAGPQAQLYEKDASTGGSAVEVPGGVGGDLETSISNQPSASSNAFVNGLYGQYYSDTNWDNRVSAYTDPLIGDGGTKFSFSTANGFSDNDPTVFAPTLRWNTASPDASGKSVKWTGQILVDTSGSQQYCTDTDDGASLTINNDSGNPQTVINDLPAAGQSTTRSCGSITLSAGWHNISVKYYNICCTGTGVDDGVMAAARLVHLEGGSYVEVPHNHLRRPMDWSAQGNVGTCNASQPLCVHTNGSTGEWSSSTPGGSPNQCSGSNDVGQITYTKSGLTPDSTYNMDISYFNEPNSTDDPVPSDYSYQVCVAINGIVLNSGNPVSLPISEPSLNPRTYTMTGITVPASGKATVTLDWLNDSYNAGSPSLCAWLDLECPYDANFGVSRLDLYRNLNAAGQLSAAPPKASATQVAVASAASSQTLAARLSNLLLPSAEAASGCTSGDPTNVLDPLNYTTSCLGASGTTTLNLGVIGESGKGYIDISTQDNSIERRITN